MDTKLEKLPGVDVLAGWLQVENHLQLAVSYRLMIASRVLQGFKRTVKGTYFNSTTKIKLHETLIRCIVVYGSGGCTMHCSIWEWRLYDAS